MTGELDTRAGERREPRASAATPPSPPETPAAVGADVVARHGSGLRRRTLLISLLTLLSRVLGFGREMLSASLFGDRSGIFDAFITAWRIPNMFRRFLGEGALSTSLQTTITRVDHEAGEDAGRRVFLATVSLVTKLLVVVCGAVMLLAWLAPHELPGTGFAWLGADSAAVRELAVRVAPFVVLICLAAVAAGALNVRGHFALPAAAPVVLNVVWIATLVAIGAGLGWHALGDPEYPPEKARQLEMVRWLAWGVLAAGALQLALLLPALRRRKLLRPPHEPAPSPAERAAARRGAWEVLKRSTPLALGAAVYQINVMIDGLMAESLLDEGGPTLHYYANRIQQFPMALIAVAATSAVFPALTAYGQTGKLPELRRLHDATQRAVVFLALPASLGLIVLAHPIVAVAFERGAFGAEGVARTAAALRMLAFAILPAGAVGLVARAYYSLGDFTTPVRVSIAMLALNAALNVACIRGLGMDVDGLALATAVTSWGNLALLLPRMVGRLGLPPSGDGLRSGTGRMLVAAAACGAAAWGANALLAARIGAAPALLVAMAVGVAAWAASSEWLAIPEWRSVRVRLRRASVPNPDARGDNAR